MTVALVTRADVEVCLVTGQGEALIDAQPLVSGSEQGPFPAADNYRLDLDGGGAVKLTLDGKSQLVSSEDSASYDIDSNGVKKASSYQGPGCP